MDPCTYVRIEEASHSLLDISRIFFAKKTWFYNKDMIDDILICCGNQYFTTHNVLAVGDCNYRSICLSPITPFTNYSALCDELCNGLSNVL